MSSNKQKSLYEYTFLCDVENCENTTTSIVKAIKYPPEGWKYTGRNNQHICPEHVREIEVLDEKIDDDHPIRDIIKDINSFSDVTED